MEKLMPKTKKYLSFFSGAMGLDLGLEEAGWECLAANEFDKKICETIRLNKPDTKLYNCDARELSADRLMSELNIKKGELFAIVGGPPCQAFSTAGKRMGLNDERGNVFLHFIDIIEGLQPKYAVIENVRGLLSAPLNYVPHKDRESSYGKDLQEKAGGALFLIIKRLEKAGYKVSFNLYDTSLYGVPQKRERVVILASREGEEIPYLIPTHGPGKKALVTVKDAFKGIKAKEFLKFPEKRLEFLRKIGPGGNWRNLTEEDQKKAMGKSYFLGGGKTGFYRRLDWNKPSPTLVTSPLMPATTLAHPTEDRPLSVEEYAAIQTFPKDYKFGGNTIYKYKQIGNAIPCVFGKVIGEHLNKFDQGSLTNIPKDYSTSRYNNTGHKSWIVEYLKSTVAKVKEKVKGKVKEEKKQKVKK